MAVLLIPAAFLGIIAIALLCLAIAGAILTVVLRVLTGILWVTVKILEHRSAAGALNAAPREPEILIIIEDGGRLMRDVTPRKTMRQLKATALRVR